LCSNFFVCDAQFNLSRHRHDFPRLVTLETLDGPDPPFPQVDSLSFRSVQGSPFTSAARSEKPARRSLPSVRCAQVVHEELK
jgi:hypothetical protein